MDEFFEFLDVWNHELRLSCVISVILILALFFLLLLIATWICTFNPIIAGTLISIDFVSFLVLLIKEIWSYHYIRNLANIKGVNKNEKTKQY